MAAEGCAPKSMEMTTTKTFSPIVQLAIPALLAFVVIMLVYQVGVMTAFLNEVLNEEIYSLAMLYLERNS